MCRPSQRKSHYSDTIFDFARDNLLFIRDNTRWIGAGFLLTMFSSFFIGLSGNELRNTFHLPGGELGGLYMLATLASAVTLSWLGRTLDLMPGGKVVRFSMACARLRADCSRAGYRRPGACDLSVAFVRPGNDDRDRLHEVGRWFVENQARAMA